MPRAICIRPQFYGLSLTKAFAPENRALIDLVVSMINWGLQSVGPNNIDEVVPAPLVRLAADKRGWYFHLKNA
jgi:hypothetical protein